ncbi:hypothetical protein CV019_13715, partial [Staphylococcus haemolyticus]
SSWWQKVRPVWARNRPMPAAPARTTAQQLAPYRTQWGRCTRTSASIRPVTARWSPSASARKRRRLMQRKRHRQPAPSLRARRQRRQLPQRRRRRRHRSRCRTPRVSRSTGSSNGAPSPRRS